MELYSAKTELTVSPKLGHFKQQLLKWSRMRVYCFWSTCPVRRGYVSNLVKLGP